MGGAITIAAHYSIPEVCVFFNSKLMRGNRTSKLDAEKYNGFSSPNYPDLGNLGCDLRIRWEAVRAPPDPLAKLTLVPALTDDILVIRISPGLSPTILRNLLINEQSGKPRTHAVVLQTFGAGNAPDTPEFLAVIRDACAAGVVIANVTQCTEGSVAAHYAVGASFSAAGVVGCGDMTTEGAVEKLRYLVAKQDMAAASGGQYQVDVIRQMLGKNLRGELTPVRGHQDISLSST